MLPYASFTRISTGYRGRAVVPPIRPGDASLTLPMSTDERGSPHSKRPARAARPRETLWVLTKRSDTLRCELRDFARLGVELQIYVNDEISNGRHYQTRELALIEGGSRRQQFLKQGWTEGTTKGV